MADKGIYSFENAVFASQYDLSNTTSNLKSPQFFLSDSLINYNQFDSVPKMNAPEPCNDELIVKPVKKLKAMQNNTNMLSNPTDINADSRTNKGKMLSLNIRLNNEAQDTDQKAVKHEESNINTPVPYSSFSKASTAYFSDQAELSSQIKQNGSFSFNEEQQSTARTIMERNNYANFFTEMHDTLLLSFQKQLEFLNLLKGMNQPDKAQYWPVLDKINPLIAGVMTKKTKIDENTLTVMKRTHNLMKAGPVHRTHQQDKKGNLDYTKQEDEGVRNVPMKNGKRDHAEFEGLMNPGSLRDPSVMKERETDIAQIMEFILYDAGKVQQEEFQKKEES